MKPTDFFAIDSEDMRGHIERMDSHILQAMSLTETGLQDAQLPKTAWSNIIVCGMGGSAIAADIVAGYLKELTVPLLVVRDYTLPSYVTSSSLIVVASYSGNTEETLSLFHEALSRKLSIVAITTGGELGRRCSELRIPILVMPSGMQPRAALAFSIVSLLLLLERLALIAPQRDLLVSASQHLEALNREPSALRKTAFALAQSLTDRIAVIYSASPIIAAIGTRWRGQIQENAKHLVMSSTLPEMTHNEVNAWQVPTQMLARMHVVLLRSPEDEHPRIQLRFRLLEDFFATRHIACSTVISSGASRLDRLFSLIAAGDWVSYYLAILTHVDPTPIPAIESLKSQMKNSG